MMVFFGFRKNLFYKIIPILSISLFAAPIQLKFTLPEKKFVTLVMDDSTGVRVRNLISEMPLPAGSHTITWDTVGDIIQIDGAQGVINQSKPPVKPGSYTIRGIMRDSVNLRYEFTVVNPGNPPWETVDGKGQWLSDHAPPASAIFIPESSQIMIGASTSESTVGMMWLNLDGRKVKEMKDFGNSRSPTFLARDPITGKIYAAQTGFGSIWNLTGKNYRVVANFANEGKLWGLAVNNNLIVISKRDSGVIVFAVPDSGVKGNYRISSPRGLIFDKDGNLYVASGRNLLKCTMNNRTVEKVDTIAKDLGDLHQLTIDSSQNIYVSIWDTLNCIRVINPQGEIIRTIGKVGPLRAGKYDPTHADHPFGMTIDSRNHLWVAEAHYVPKRVSCWTLQGELINHWIGPTQYGGGGFIDPNDSTKFIYKERGTTEFTIDWATGKSKMTAILNTKTECPSPYMHNNIRYTTNEHSGYPTWAPKLLEIFKIENDTTRRVAMIGSPEPLKKDTLFRGLWDTTRVFDYLFTWSDANNNGILERSEATFHSLPGYNNQAFALRDDWTVIFSTNKGIYCLPIESFSDAGVPQIDISKLYCATTKKAFQGYVSKDTTTSLSASPWLGMKNDKTIWNYPNLWPNMHTSWNNREPPRYPGEMIGTTVLLYNPIQPRNSDIGEIIPINGNFGNIYLLSMDGLYVATLFQDYRVASKPFPQLSNHRGSGRGGWHMPEAIRGMSVNHVSGGEEQFWPSITQVKSGGIYCVAGHEHASVIKVEGLETIRRVNFGTISISDTSFTKSQTFTLQPSLVSISKQKTINSIGKFTFLQNSKSLLKFFSPSSSAKFRIYTCSGRTVLNHVFTNDISSIELQKSRFVKGIYYFEIINSRSRMNGSFVIN